jgi:hypothetical protein
MENIGIFYDHFVCFTAIGNILWPFDIFCGYLVYFSHFGILDQEKSGNPGRDREFLIESNWNGKKMKPPSSSNPKKLDGRLYSFNLGQGDQMSL